MTTPRVRYNPPFTRYLVEQGVLKDQPFSLVDVGASGGNEQHWQAFRSGLRAWGFQPLVAEGARVNGTKSSGDVSDYGLGNTSLAEGPQVFFGRQARLEEQSAFHSEQLGASDRGNENELRSEVL